MRKPINWINLLCWIAYGILFSMFGMLVMSYFDEHGWKTAIAVPFLILFFGWLLRKPLIALAIWAGLSN